MTMHRERRRGFARGAWWTDRAGRSGGAVGPPSGPI